MKKLSMIFVLIIAMITSGCGASKEYKTLHDEVIIVIADMISLSQRALYADMVNQYFDPAYVEQYGTATIINEFKMERNDIFFRTLRACERIQPTINQKTSLVTFNSTTFPYAMNFKKIDGRWYYMPE